MVVDVFGEEESVYVGGQSEEESKVMIRLKAGTVVEDVAPHCIDGSGSDSDSDSCSGSGSGSGSGSAWHRAQARHSSLQVKKKAT